MLFALELSFFSFSSSFSLHKPILHFSINKSFCIRKAETFFLRSFCLLSLTPRMSYDALFSPRPFISSPSLNTCLPSQRHIVSRARESQSSHWLRLYDKVGSGIEFRTTAWGDRRGTWKLCRKQPSRPETRQRAQFMAKHSSSVSLISWLRPLVGIFMFFLFLYAYKTRHVKMRTKKIFIVN